MPWHALDYSDLLGLLDLIFWLVYAIWPNLVTLGKAAIPKCILSTTSNLAFRLTVFGIVTCVATFGPCGSMSYFFLA